MQYVYARARVQPFQLLIQRPDFYESGYEISAIEGNTKVLFLLVTLGCINMADARTCKPLPAVT
jgi:hypothetical protein